MGFMGLEKFAKKMASDYVSMEKNKTLLGDDGSFQKELLPCDKHGSWNKAF